MTSGATALERRQYMTLSQSVWMFLHGKMRLQVLAKLSSVLRRQNTAVGGNGQEIDKSW